jgi:ATP-dependent Clp protease ATP-binding subunit ClpA
MFERFTDPAREVLRRAATETHDLGHGFLGTEHLLLGMLDLREGLAFQVLDAAGVSHDAVRGAVVGLVGPAVDDEALAVIGIDADAVRRAVEESFGRGALERAVAGQRRAHCQSGPPLTRRTKKVLELSLREAISLRHHHIGTEHLLLALIREGDGVAARVLRLLAPDTDFRQVVIQRLRAAS